MLGALDHSPVALYCCRRAYRAEVRHGAERPLKESPRASPLIVEHLTDDELENSHCHKVCHPIA